jgi:ankyrin repeat protein
MYENLSKKLDLDRKFNDALFSWDIEAVKELFADNIENKPDINRDLVSCPAILIAAMEKQWDMFELLYTLEADLDVKLISNDWHLIHECVKNAPVEITTTLTEYCNLNVQTEDGKTPLMIAIREKNGTVANLLLNTKTLRLDFADIKGDNAAHYAARAGMDELFLSLIREGVPLNRKNKEGKYPADLIENEFFKQSIPQVEAQIVKESKKATVQESLDEKPKKSEDKPAGLSGLSKIKKKF